MVFTHDWFHDGGLESLTAAARRRCLVNHFGDESLGAELSPDQQEYAAALETRTIIYLKDGLTYEMRHMLHEGPSMALTFECIPVDENYRVGAIVITAPLEDVARVEVFAVHPDEKPEESIRIPGFRVSGNE